jgi:hypothetical protein
LSAFLKSRNIDLVGQRLVRVAPRPQPNPDRDHVFADGECLAPVRSASRKTREISASPFRLAVLSADSDDTKPVVRELARLIETDFRVS